jgi:hypothetical protein
MFLVLVVIGTETPRSIVALIISAHIFERPLKKTPLGWEQMSDRYRLN